MIEFHILKQALKIDNATAHQIRFTVAEQKIFIFETNFRVCRCSKMAASIGKSSAAVVVGDDDDAWLYEGDEIFENHIIFSDVLAHNIDRH